MDKKSKTRFMKAIVWVCLLFTAGELLLTVVLRLLEKEDTGKKKEGNG